MQVHPSDSTVQQEAEINILHALEVKLNCEPGLLRPERIQIKNSHVELDGYNSDLGILCEAYAHIGKLKVAQTYKVINDAMKMLLVEKVTGKAFRKIIAVCDIEVEKQLSSNGWKSLALSEFGIEIMWVEIGDCLRNEIVEAQKRQYR